MTHKRAGPPISPWLTVLHFSRAYLPLSPNSPPVSLTRFRPVSPDPPHSVRQGSATRTCPQYAAPCALRVDGCLCAATQRPKCPATLFRSPGPWLRGHECSSQKLLPAFIENYASCSGESYVCSPLWSPRSHVDKTLAQGRGSRSGGRYLGASENSDRCDFRHPRRTIPELSRTFWRAQWAVRPFGGSAHPIYPPIHAAMSVAEVGEASAENSDMADR